MINTAKTEQAHKHQLGWNFQKGTKTHFHICSSKAPLRAASKAKFWKATDQCRKKLLMKCQADDLTHAGQSQDGQGWMRWRHVSLLSVLWVSISDSSITSPLFQCLPALCFLPTLCFCSVITQDTTFEGLVACPSCCTNDFRMVKYVRPRKPVAGTINAFFFRQLMILGVAKVVGYLQ